MKFLIAVLLVVPTLSFADHKPCHADIETFCKEAPKKKGAVMKCLKEHMAELQPACQEKIQKVKSHAKKKKHNKHKKA